MSTQTLTPSAPRGRDLLSPIRTEDIPLLSSYYLVLDDPLADLNAHMMVAWQPLLGLHYLIESGILYVFASHWEGAWTLWGPPIGPGLSLEHIDRSFTLLAQLSPGRESHRALYVWDRYCLWDGLKNRAGFFLEPEASEYIYTVRKLAALAGRPYRKKRNEVRGFRQRYAPDTRPFEPRDAPACLDLLARWRRHREKSFDSRYRNKLEMESEVCAHALTRRLPLSGVVVRVEGRLVAFSIGADQGNGIFNCMFEKADHSFRGVSSFVFHALAQYLMPRYREVNAGEDWGVDYLARSKMAWRPVRCKPSYSLRKQV